MKISKSRKMAKNGFPSIKRAAKKMTKKEERRTVGSEKRGMQTEKPKTFLIYLLNSFSTALTIQLSKKCCS